MRVIEDKLLACLTDDEDKVAIVVNKVELELLIRALACDPRCDLILLDGMKALHRGAFE